MFIYLLFYMYIMTAPTYERYLIRAREARETRYEELQRIEEEQRIEEQKKMESNEYLYSEFNPKKPEILEVYLKNTNGQGHMGLAQVRDVSDVDMLSSMVVGLVGSPFEISFDETYCTPILQFTYDENELWGMPERNMIVLFKNEYNKYEQIIGETIDEEKNTITVPIEKSGTYMVADRFNWYSVLNNDLSDYDMSEYDMTEYAYLHDFFAHTSDWEIEYDTGNIMDLVDKEWVKENEPVFHVRTPEELAGAVYYVNALDLAGSVKIILENDIDLKGLKWVPMGGAGKHGNEFWGEIDGKGHTISNMSIMTDYNLKSGFIGFSADAYVHDIQFDNAQVVSSSYSGIVAGEILGNKKWKNIKVNGKIVGTDLKECGSLVGRENGLSYENCSADVIYVDASDHATPMQYFSRRQEVIDTTPVEEKFVLEEKDDGGIKRTTGENDDSLTWVIEIDGQVVLKRSAMNEELLAPKWIKERMNRKDSKCRVWLEAYDESYYLRVSNILEYQVK